MSSQVAPSVRATASQRPLVALQAISWQSSGGASPEQSTAVPAQTPPVQMSVVVQASMSSQVAPSVRATASQAPLAGLQAISWQSSGGASPEQSMAPVPAHIPPVQTSPVVQAFMSSQASPSSIGTASHWPVSGLQARSLQAGAICAEQSTTDASSN